MKEVWRIINDSKILLPVIAGSLPAGFPSPAADYIENSIDLNTLLISNPTATFFAQVHGDSMTGAFIHPTATHLIIDRSLAPKHRDIVVAIVLGEFTVKRYLILPQGVMLAAENPKFKPIPISEGIDAEIWGVVTYIITEAQKI